MTVNWRRDPPDTGDRKDQTGSQSLNISTQPHPERDSRSNLFSSELPTRSLSQLILPASTRAALDAALSRITNREILYGRWNLKKIDPKGSRVAINFFGPPGTGKSLCAEAIAHYLQRRIVKVNYAEIESKYVGETPKNIVAAFKMATDTGAVLFFDEADSVLGRRLTNVTQSADHGVNVSRTVMLLQLDQFEGIVLFATNLAENYDSAFVRRIMSHIEFVLPDLECRSRIWEQLIPAELPLSPECTVSWLADVSAELSGGDMLNVIINAASHAVQRSPPRQILERPDFELEIQRTLTARKKVGSGR